MECEHFLLQNCILKLISHMDRKMKHINKIPYQKDPTSINYTKKNITEPSSKF